MDVFAFGGTGGAVGTGRAAWWERWRGPRGNKNIVPPHVIRGTTPASRTVQ